MGSSSGTGEVSGALWTKREGCFPVKVHMQLTHLERNVVLGQRRFSNEGVGPKVHMAADELEILRRHTLDDGRDRWLGVEPECTVWSMSIVLRNAVGCFLWYDLSGRGGLLLSVELRHEAISLPDRLPWLMAGWLNVLPFVSFGMRSGSIQFYGVRLCLDNRHGLVLLRAYG
jgi:hypothetical protein